MSEKVREISPSYPITTFYNLSIQEGGFFLTEDNEFLGFDGIDFIDHVQYNPILDEILLDTDIESVIFVIDDVEKVLDIPSVSYLMTSENNFIRTQQGDFLTL